MPVIAVVACVVAAVVGVVAGFAIGRVRIRRSAGTGDAPTVAELIHRVVDSSHNGVIVLNKWGDVVLHNPRAAELGLVQKNRVDERARTAAQRSLAEQTTVMVDLSPLAERTLSWPGRGRRPQAVLGEVRPVAEEFAVIDASDESDSVRLEATRRDFVANVSHELKTPVGALALLAEAVLDASDDPDQVRHFAGKILHEATRLGSLVTELIALSRLQGAERLPEQTEVSIDEVVDEAIGRTKLTADTAGIEVTTDNPSDFTVNGDRTLLVTALVNLVENAVAYSAKAGPVSVSRKLVGKTVEIAVTDRGIGIAPEHQQRVFERFYRVDKARSRATGGTGLGLAIVKHVAVNHGGTVKLWSRPGVGSTFTLCIPVRQESKRPESKKPESKKPELKKPDSRKVESKRLTGNNNFNRNDAHVDGKQFAGNKGNKFGGDSVTTADHGGNK